MNRLLSLSLTLSFALAGCSSQSGYDDLDDNGDFLSKVEGGDVLIIVSQSFGINDSKHDGTEAEMFSKLSQNANELKAFYETDKNANVDKVVVHALASRSIDERAGISKHEFDLFDTRKFDHSEIYPSQMDYLETKLDGTFAPRNHENWVDSALEVLIDQGKTYDRVIMMAPGHADGPVFTKNRVPGVNYPNTSKEGLISYTTEFYDALGKITNPGGWIYFTGVNPDKDSGFDGFDNFLDMASCLTGRHTLASRTDSVMWKEHTRIMKMDKSDTVDAKHSIEGIRVQTPCDVDGTSEFTCRSADSNDTCRVQDQSFTTEWGECSLGGCVNIEYGQWNEGNTIGGLCPGPANIRCMPVELVTPPPMPSTTYNEDRCHGGAVGWCIDTSQGEGVGECSTVGTLEDMPVGKCPGAAEIRCCPDESQSGVSAGPPPVANDDTVVPLPIDGEECEISRQDQSSAKGVCMPAGEVSIASEEIYFPQAGDCSATPDAVCVFVESSDDSYDYPVYGDAAEPNDSNPNVASVDGECEVIGGSCTTIQSCDGDASEVQFVGDCGVGNHCCVPDEPVPYEERFTAFDKGVSPDTGMEAGRCVPRSIACASEFSEPTDGLIQFYLNTDRDYCPNDGDDYYLCPVFK